MKIFYFKNYLIVILLTLLTQQLISAQINNAFQVPVSNCINLGANSNTDGWGMFWRSGYYNQNEFLSQNSGSSFQMGSTSNTGINQGNNSISFADQTEYTNETGFAPDIFGSINSSGNIINPVFLKIGNNLLTTSNGSEEVTRKFVITPNNSLLFLDITTLFKNLTQNPKPAYFKYKITVQYQDDMTFLNLPANVSTYFLSAGAGFPSNKHFKSINFIDYNINFCKTPVVTISMMVSDGGSNIPNAAYAYIHAHCMDEFDVLIPIADKPCNNVVYPLLIDNYFSGTLGINDTINWNITYPDDTTVVNLTGNNASFSFPDPGLYNIILTITKADSNCIIDFSRTIQIENCSLNDDIGINCKDCSSFSLIKNEKYIVSGWTKLMQESGPDTYENITPVPSYNNVFIGVTFLDTNGAIIDAEMEFYPSGNIIDGWQKIQGEITIPDTIEDIKIGLVNVNENSSAFFDDIRVHPYNGNLKSFVYDQASQKLMAELDENNYATFYEYDKEGGLIRVKKETEKGVYTIQETRSSTKKTE